MREVEARIVQTYLEAGKVVYLAFPAGSIIAKQEKDYCTVQFLGKKITGRAASLVILDDLEEKSLTKKKQKDLLKWYKKYRLTRAS